MKSWIENVEILRSQYSERSEINVDLSDVVDSLYLAFRDTKHIQPQRLPRGLRHMVYEALKFYRKESLIDDFEFYDFELPKIVPTGKIELLSGGLDSCYQALVEDVDYCITDNKANDTGISEYDGCVEFCKRIGKPLFVYSEFYSYKKGMQEHPLKNQIMALQCVQAMYDLNCALCIGSLGNADEDIEHEDNRRYWSIFCCTDMFAVTNAFNEFLPCDLILISEASKIPKLQLIMERGLLDCVRSCIAVRWYASTWREPLNKHYGVKLLPGRCGACCKCRQEAVALWYLGYDYPMEYIRHCVKGEHPDLSLEDGIRHILKVDFTT